MTRSEATALGLKTYSNGVPCKHGHAGERYTNTGVCLECNRIRNQLGAKRRYDANPKEWNKRSRRWQAENPEKAATSRRNWKQKNKNRVREYQAKWSESHPGYFRLKATERLDYVLQATPKWADIEAIKLFYANTPKGHHVDHEIPLRGKTVCGLHTVENFQYLTALDNQRKSNKL